ncbi:MAG: MBOAT family protein [Candidatus Omnitrophica bacterium]|nr:MBOAT family protein [Candidatus Omnitrophota bacterium]
MLFNSLHFLIFFPLVVILFFFLPFRFRLIFLLAASYYFYMAWKPVYILIIIVSTLGTWASGLWMERFPARRSWALAFSFLVNLGMLFFFKYFNFLNHSLAGLAQALHGSWGIPDFSILLPIAISFHTFQALSYSIDLYRGEIKAEKNLLLFAVFTSFFPQLVAGPIERTKNLLHQFEEKQSFDAKRMASGLKLMAWGMFKKVVIADRFAVAVNSVYNHPADYQGPALMAATIFFAFQIYCDFSGYSDIAVGSAEVMGFRLMTNFKRPYLAQNIVEFWRRWHISLSTWFRDYVYISLGGNRVSRWRHFLNLFITFFISGIWHGANWTFALWGTLHGLFMVLFLATEDLRKKVSDSLRLSQYPRLSGIFSIVLTFAFVSFAWIFFRANTVHDAFYIVRNLFKGFDTVFSLIGQGNIMAALNALRAGGFGIGKSGMAIVLSALFILYAVQYFQESGEGIRIRLEKLGPVVRWFLYYALVFSMLGLGVFGSNKFIYFQF